jgi:tetratricopeptide (TPR) repeat protein
LRDADPATAAKWALAAADRSLDRGLDGAARRVLEPAFEAIQRHRTPGLSARLRFRLSQALVRAMLGEGGEGELLDRAIAEGDRLVAESIDDAHPSERADWELLAAEALYRNRRFEEVERRTVRVSQCAGVSIGSTLRGAFLRAASMPMTDFAMRNTELESVRDLLEPALAGATEGRIGVLLRVKAEVLNTLGFGRLRGEGAKSAEDALACFEEALAINRGESAPDRRGARISLGGRGDALQRLGRAEESERCYTENLEGSREDGDLAGVTRMTSILSSFALDRVESEASADREADLASAESLLVESLRSADLQKSPDGMAFAFAGLLRHARLAGQDPSPLLARIADRRSQLESCRSFSREALEKAMVASTPP